MLRWYVYLMNLVKDEEGQDLVEYALLLSLIAIGSVAAIQATGGSIQGLWNAVSGAVTAAIPT